MNHIQKNNNDNLDDEDEFFEEEADQKKSDNKAAAWFISIFVHIVLVGSLLYILMPAKEKMVDVVITTTPIPIEEKEEEEKEIDIVKEKVEVEVEVEVETSPVITEEVVDDHNESENEMEAESAEGISEAISDMPLVGSGVMGNIGGGGGGGGAFGQRTGGGRKKAVMRGGGSKKTESAVDLGLWWLAHHQEPDGHWDTGKYEGAGTPRANTACTGAALLAFLGAGHTDKVGKWRKNVRNAIKWLLDAQLPNGSFPGDNYTNGICTMAIAEAAGMGAGGTKSIKSAKLAVDFLLKQQNTKGGYDYKGNTARDDMSITGWCVMGLKSAMVSGIRENEIKAAFKKVAALLDHPENATTTADNTSESKGRAWYASGDGENRVACNAIAMLIRQYLGWHRTEPWLEAAGNFQIRTMPKSYADLNIYRTYYAFLTLFQQGGAKWKQWNKPISDIIVKAQRQDGDFKGSWDMNGKSWVMAKGGRVLNTAFLVLSLEVYYRYKSVMK